MHLTLTNNNDHEIAKAVSNSTARTYRISSYVITSFPMAGVSARRSTLKLILLPHCESATLHERIFTA